MTFGNLKAEMAREGISQEELAEFLKMTPTNLRGKFTGRVKWSLNECKRIINRYFPTLTIDYLFADTDNPNDCTADALGREHIK
jgi:transcriptional regulator with XRE-family HTH domain